MVSNGSREANNPAAYSENATEMPFQSVFTLQEISPGSFDDDNRIEMVPEVLSIRQSGSMEGADFEDEGPSNERLLLIAFVTFATFTMFQTGAAFIAGSEAMIGDSWAMVVDAITYLFNLVAERRKSRFEEHYKEPQHLSGDDSVRRAKLKQRTKRKLILRMEIIPPVVSVATLLGVTVYVLHDSLQMLLLDFVRDRSEQGEPNLSLMLIFSCLNLLLDLVNMFCFARAKRLFGYAMPSKRFVHGSTQSSVGSLQLHTPRQFPPCGFGSDSGHDAEERELHDDIVDMTFDNGFEAMEAAYAMTTREPEDGSNANDDVDGRKSQKQDESDAGEEKDAGGDNEANLNMCSAYTHVFADTLRSLAVIIAATVAHLAHEVTSEEADATAAVVVSALILFSLFPLLSGLVSTCRELRSIHAEERDEHKSVQDRDLHRS